MEPLGVCCAERLPLSNFWREAERELISPSLSHLALKTQMCFKQVFLVFKRI